MRIGVVMLNRRRPVAISPTELFHPVSPLLAFPTGQPGEVYISIPPSVWYLIECFSFSAGGIGCPLWAVACSQFRYCHAMSERCLVLLLYILS